MNFEFLLPDIGEGMAEAEITEWFVAIGDVVAVDQPVASVETDKMSVDLPSPVAGTVVSLAADVGERVMVHAPLMTVDTVGVPPAIGVANGSDGAGSATAPAEEPTLDSTRVTAAPPSLPTDGRPKASPAVRHLARQRQIDLTTIAGSGPSGRILRTDLDHFEPVAAAVTGSGAPERAPSGSSVGTERIPFRGIRRKIAENVAKSWSQIPMALDFREVDGEQLLRLRKALLERAPEGASVSFDAILVRIVASALQRHRMLNATLDEQASEVVLHGEINIGIAVGAETGVVVPVIHGANDMNVYDIALRLKDVADRARAGRLEASDLKGGTFTLNNTGALAPKGGLHMLPLINWPQAAMVAFGRIHDRVVAVDGQPAVRPRMFMTCNADHRLVDGEGLVAFMNDVVDFVENPARLIGELR